MSQLEAALRAGISRSTASNIEGGSPSVAVGQVIRYLDAIAPGKSLQQLISHPDVAVELLDESTRRKRASTISIDDPEEPNSGFNF